MREMGYLPNLKIIAVFCFVLAIYNVETTERCSDLPCDDGECILRGQWCDENEDCSDGSDEAYCKKKSIWSSSDPNKCKDTHFLCDDGICIPSIARCDSENDCENGEDEDECAEEIITTTELSKETDSPPDYDDTEPPYEPEEISSFNEISSESSVERAVKWLLKNRRKDYSWGLDTSRVIVALALVNPTQFSDKEGLLMKKQFQVQVTVDLLRNQTKPVSLNKLAHHINAMLATCQDPKNFHGLNLVEILHTRTLFAHYQRNNQHTFVNPLVFLTLCLAESKIPFTHTHFITNLLNPGSQEMKWQDMQSLAIMAMACLMRDFDFNHRYKDHLNRAVENLLLRMDSKNGSFGNIYSTALAVQALLSVDTHGRWDPNLSINFLKNQQKDNGSFGDILSTNYILPTLHRKSLLNLRNVTCTPIDLSQEFIPLDVLLNWIGPRHYVRYSLKFGKPTDVSYSLTLHVPKNATFFDIMRIAAHTDPKYKFHYGRESGNINVYSIANIPNDAELGFYWHLYVNHPSLHSRRHHLQHEGGKPYSGGIRNLIPADGDHIYFWYHSI